MHTSFVTKNVGTAVMLGIFLAVTIFVGFNLITNENMAFTQLETYCNQKFGIENWTLENGHVCPQPSLFHDCIECVSK